MSGLFEKGKIKIANKFGEEAFETVSAFLGEGKKEITEESADLLFHFMILLEDSNISLDEVLDVLKKRKKMIDIENYNNENIFAKILRMKFHLKSL